MQTSKNLWRLAIFFLTVLLFPSLAFAQHDLGEAAKAPKLPPSPAPFVPAPSDITVTGGFTVNSDSREQVRAFYNGIYPTSDNIPMESTADVTNCAPGTNSTAFVEAVLRRINWFRAMAGMPAAITFNEVYNENAQQMAVMISANNELNHNPPTNWICYTTSGASQAGGNQAIGFNGPNAITGYIWDFGANNSEVGHRRWVLVPQTQVMGTGDVPQEGTNNAANSLWVFDSSINDPRPATRQPYVSWPPEGYVPYQIVFPYWSFALSNADVSAATVSMTSNGVSVAVSIQPQVKGYGENTHVWVPMGLDATQEATTFPFNGPDTTYNVSVSNINVVNNGVTSSVSFNYNVTVFDPAVPGADYVPPVISGPSQPAVNASNLYSCAPINNPNVTSYEWVTSRLISGNLFDDADNGLANFTITPTPDYSIITNAPDGSDSNCFHLCHDNATSQFLQLNEVLYPSTNTMVSFDSYIGFATTDETARVQVSADGGNTWQDIYAQAGCASGECQPSFTPQTLSLSNYAMQPVLLRFNWAFTGGNYYPESDNFVGWCLKNIVVTNAQQLVDVTTNIPSTNSASTNFAFVPTQPGTYLLQAMPVIFGQFPLAAGPARQVTAVVPSGIVMSTPVLNGGQAQLNFTVSGGLTGQFELLQTGQLGTAWTTNTTATLTTNAPGTSYRFTTTSAPGTKFFRVLLIP